MEHLIAVIGDPKERKVGGDVLTRVLVAVAQRDADGITRDAVAEQVGLSAGAVSKAVTLLSDRRVHLVVPVDGTVDGRKRSLVHLEEDHYAALVVRVEDEHEHAIKLSGWVTDLRGVVVAPPAESKLSDGTAHAVVAGIVDLVAELRERMPKLMNRPDRSILGLAVLLGGQVDEGGTVRRSPNLSWQNEALQAALKEHFTGFGVKVSNDVTGLMVGDHLLTTHSIESPDRALVAVFDEGVGAALVIRGRAYRGKNGLAAELGHVRVDYAPEAPECRCGQTGCLEAFLRRDRVEGKGVQGYRLAGQALGRALVDLVHITDVQSVRVLLADKVFNPVRSELAKEFDDARLVEMERLFSGSGSVRIDIDYYVEDVGMHEQSLQATVARAGAALVLQMVIDEIERVATA